MSIKHVLVYGGRMRTATYKRVSTQKQELENQSNSIAKQIDVLGWTLVKEYQEVISGTKSRDSRPELRQLIADARKREFDRLVVFSLDRLGRSIVDVINTIHELEECGVHIFVVKNSIDTSTSSGRVFANFINIFSELEREMMISRQRQSIERIREKGGKWGMGNLISQEKKNEIVSLRTQGLSYREIGKKLDISHGSVQYTLKKMAA
jgi:DNA invertase Pin-like site-specific DNA recombinase